MKNAIAEKTVSGRHAPEIDIGIGAKDRARIADGLSRLLADTYTLYLKTHNFHWNITGPVVQVLFPEAPPIGGRVWAQTTSRERHV